MKKNVLWLAIALMMTITFGACTSSDADENNVEKAFAGYGLGYGSDGFGYVNGGIVNEWENPAVDKSDPLATFFEEELHRPYWDGYGNEFKTFFEQGSWDDETCLVFNSWQEFQDAYMGSKDLPEIDFNQYTLVIGRTWGNDGSFELNNVILRDLGYVYELETKLFRHHDPNLCYTAAITTFFYWRLYPKLSQKDIEIKRTVIDLVNE